VGQNAATDHEENCLVMRTTQMKIEASEPVFEGVVYDIFGKPPGGWYPMPDFGFTVTHVLSHNPP
jgi:hypothetical protein